MFASNKIEDLLHHCKTCLLMPRPDSFRCRFVCYACFYSTYLFGNIKRHVQTHLGEKPYSCPYCVFCSTHYANVKKHILRAHKDIKNVELGLLSSRPRAKSGP
uniref:C2H2-type domain-containing protein n=2 Tax=Cacopsylla melanoneura TaxID=428564 RepID=A0A8D8SRF3_9HEMI